MLDINFIRENVDAVKQAAVDKHITVDVDGLLAVDGERRALMVAVDELRARRNVLTDAIKHAATPAEREPAIAEATTLKEELQTKEEQLRALEQRYRALMITMPTVPASDVPRGADESGNVEVGRWGTMPQFDFTPRTHIELAQMHDLIDFERGAAVSGYRGYYLKNEGASLVMALMMYAYHKMAAKGFMPMMPPTLVNEDVLFGSGYFKGLEYDGSVDEVYQVATRDKNADGAESKGKKFLVGTAEPSLLAYYAQQTLDGAQLPLKVFGYSPCYRSEIGSYGKDTKGLYRVHEFFKIEQVVITPADIELAEKLQEEMIAISKEMHAELGLPYRQLAICTGDMGAGKYRQYDLEAWMPGMDRWGETGSASNLRDWQARRLDVKYKDENGNRQHVFMLNNTALPSPRVLIAILENHQNADGSITVPEVLRPFMPGGQSVIARVAQ